MGVIDATALLTESVKLLTPTRASNGAGGYTTTWATAETLHGRITSPTGRKRYEAGKGGQPTAETFADVTLKQGVTAITAKMRVQSGDDVYELIELGRQDGYVFAVGRLV